MFSPLLYQVGCTVRDSSRRSFTDEDRQRHSKLLESIHAARLQNIQDSNETREEIIEQLQVFRPPPHRIASHHLRGVADAPHDLDRTTVPQARNSNDPPIPAYLASPENTNNGRERTQKSTSERRSRCVFL